MEILNKKQKIILIIVVIIILLFIGYYIIQKTNNSQFIYLETEEEEIEQLENTEEYLEETEEIVVHVVGEVENQGIVTVKEGSRISDVIEKAGGTTINADLSKINLAYIVEDGQKIYVPSISDEEEIETVIEDAGKDVIEDIQAKSEKVNINTANQTELETLSGIGPSTALKIIEYREENGKFTDIEEIKNVSGIGDAKYESIKDYICVK